MAKNNATSRTFKDNFWSLRRVEKNVKIHELAELIGKGEKQTGMYFSGQLMPPPNIIQALCDLLDVSFNEGELAFQQAHRTWKAEHTRSCKATNRVVVNEPEPEAVADTISVAEVKKMFATRKQYAKSALYGIVDLDVYEKIIALFEVNL